ncbi:MAG: hypothetical protein FJW31_27415 [Acidobacteria bacterium]|nr:hypothetical protein [Acidobacteriota bacterium]
MQSNLMLIVASILFPPAGLWLLWRKYRGGSRRVLMYGSAAIVLLGVVELFKVYGLRIVLDGSTTRPFFTFSSPASCDAAVEAHRSSLGAIVAEAPPPAAPRPAAEPEASVVQAAGPVPPPPPAPAPAVAPIGYWTDYRGPNRLGIYGEQPILTAWPAAGLTRLWKQPIGGGYASFTVSGGLAVTIEQRRKNEVVAAYDVLTGREKWTAAWPGHFSESMGGDGPRTTPVIEGGRVYALGAEGELRVLDATTGRAIWNKNILTENGANNLTWGQSASPLLLDGKLIVLPGGGGGKSVVAYDKLTGNKLWSVMDDEQAYASPIVATLAGKRQLLVVSAQRAMGLDPEDGRLLWDFPWVTEYNVNATHPIVVAPNRFFISSGYDHGAALVELTPEGDKFKARVVWQNKRMKNKFNDSVLHQGHLYGLDEGILACVNAETGQQMWKGGRYGFGQLLLASGHLVVLSERGELALVKASPSGHQEVARFDAISGKTWNNPAIAGGVLLVRNTEEMAAFRIGKQ